MPTTRETILVALHARLSATPATALRGAVLPERVPAEGLLILRDGEPGELEVTLSPLAYHYQHRAEIEAIVQGADRDATFDSLTATIGAALAADRTLGGLCDWVEAVEWATLEWVDWYNHRRLLEPLGHVPPAEAEARYYDNLEDTALAA